MARASESSSPFFLFRAEATMVVRMRWDRSDLYLRAIILEFMFRRALIYG